MAPFGVPHHCRENLQARFRMNQLELYKRLPRKNCGKCRAGACMPFAFSVISGSAELSECPLLSSEEISKMAGSVRTSDWRAELVRKIGDEIRTMDFSKIAAGLGAGLNNGNLLITCMGRQFEISTDGMIVTSGEITPWMKILLLHYIRTAGSGDPAGKWVGYGDLKAGMVKASSFHRECEEPLREMFEEDSKSISRALEKLGAENAGDMPSKYAWQIRLLPKITILILYWPAEDEFPSKINVLFDATADRFLDAESLIFLVEGFIRNLERLCSRE